MIASIATTELRYPKEYSLAERGKIPLLELVSPLGLEPMSFRLMLAISAFVLTFQSSGCQPSLTPVPTGSTTPITSSAPNNPAGLAPIQLAFPSRNGAISLPPGINPDGLTVTFGSDTQQVQGSLEKNDTTVLIRKPLTAPPTGRITFVSGTGTVTAGTYTSSADQIELSLNVQDAAWPLRVEPIEAVAQSGNRRLLVPVNSRLSLTLVDGHQLLAETTIDAQGNVATVAGRVTGGPATLRIDALPIQLETGGVGVPIRLSPFEPEFKVGNRLVRVVPSVPISMLLADNSIGIREITVDPDGSVSQPQGHIKPAKGTIEPVTRALPVDIGGYAGAWRVARYEPVSKTGSRTIPVVAADRQLIFNIGNLETSTPPIDPTAPNGAFRLDGETLRLNLKEIEVNPADCKASYLVYPAETTFSSGRRIVSMPLLASRAIVLLVSSADEAGRFEMTPDGTLASLTPGLRQVDGQVQFNTLAVRVDTIGSSNAYRIMPFEERLVAGSRTVTMVRGVSARIDTHDESIPFQIDQSGTLTCTDRRVSATSAGLSISWSN
jgi:hypothetical protein